jgi:Zn-dependent protease
MEFIHPTLIIAILIALSVHEWAHAFVATQLGDPTAKAHGRLTLNPLAHLDPLGTLLLLLVHFGWGKPVPIDPRYFRNPKRDSALTALAGPCSNFILAAFCYLFLVLFFAGHGASSVLNLLSTTASHGPVVQAFFRELLAYLLFINLGLMAFNLLPIAPLDGSRILEAFIPLRFEDAYSAFMSKGPYILLGLLVAERLLDVSFLTDWITWIMEVAFRIFQAVMGG